MHDPLGMSTKRIVGRPPIAAWIRSSSLPRSQSVLLTGVSAPLIPLIDSTACTSATARPPCAATTPFSSLIVLAEVVPHPRLLLHLLDQFLVELRRHIDPGVAQQVHHRHRSEERRVGKE